MGEAAGLDDANDQGGAVVIHCCDGSNAHAVAQAGTAPERVKLLRCRQQSFVETTSSSAATSSVPCVQEATNMSQLAISPDVTVPALSSNRLRGALLYAVPLGRALFSAIFIFAGFNHFSSATIGYALSQGLP